MTAECRGLIYNSMVGIFDTQVSQVIGQWLFLNIYLYASHILLNNSFFTGAQDSTGKAEKGKPTVLFIRPVWKYNKSEETDRNICT